MSPMAVSLSALRRLPHIHRQSLNQQEVLRGTVMISIEHRRSFSQSPWPTWIAESPTVIGAEQLLTRFHEISGLPWWATIAITTIALRSVTSVPAGIHVEAVSAKIKNLESEIKEINKILKQEAVMAKHAFDWTEKKTTMVYKANLKLQIRRLFERDNCHPMKIHVLGMIQIPVWVSVSVALREIARVGSAGSFEYSSLSTEGVLWIKNLLEADPYLILPLMTVMLHLANIEVYNLKFPSQSRLAEAFRYISRGLCLLVLPFGYFLPSTISLYWFCSAFMAVGQNVLLMSPRFRRFVRIPITAHEDATPYSTLWAKLRARYLRLKD